MTNDGRTHPRWKNGLRGLTYRKNVDHEMRSALRFIKQCNTSYDHLGSSPNHIRSRLPSPTGLHLLHRIMFANISMNPHCACKHPPVCTWQIPVLLLVRIILLRRFWPTSDLGIHAEIMCSFDAGHRILRTKNKDLRKEINLKFPLFTRWKSTKIFIA